MVYIYIKGVLRGTYASNSKRLEDDLWIFSGVLLLLTLIMVVVGDAGENSGPSFPIHALSCGVNVGHRWSVHCVRMV